MLTLLLCFVCLLTGRTDSHPIATPPSARALSPGALFPRSELADIHPGDIILRKGNTFLSDMIARAFPQGQDLSHCGIIVDTPRGLSVIHTISGRISDRDGIRLTPLLEFVSEAQDLRVKIIRPKENVNKDKLCAAAFRCLQARIPFDHEFRLDDDKALYCSELVRKVMLEAGSPDIFRYKTFGSTPVIDMASFADTSAFLLVLPTQR